jgi:small subunit ribosomal protein S16
MVIIRLSRGGSKKRPYFNVVVQDSRKRRDGRFIERIGFYNPMATAGSETLRLDSERVDYWKKNGAQVSETMSRIIKLQAKGPAGLEAMKKADEKRADLRKAKKEAAKAPAAEEVASAAEEAAPAAAEAAPAAEEAAPAAEEAAPAAEEPKSE